MELAIPFIALGGLYVISNQDKEKKQNNTTKEAFTSSLPNTHIQPINYPIQQNSPFTDEDALRQYIPNHKASDIYVNQTNYETRVNNGYPVSNIIQQTYQSATPTAPTAPTASATNKDYTHNNMVPFEGGKPRGQLYGINRSESILDNYSGSGSQMIKKTEQAPLFAPQDNMQWTYGTPNVSDFMQSRVNPALRNNMVKPFETIQPQRGGSSGFNSGMENRDAWMPKTVDELRVSTNPKEEYTLDGLQGPSKSHVTNVGSIGQTEKYRPDTFFINSQDRWLTTTGAEKGQRTVADEIQKTIQRPDCATYQVGTANSTLKTASYTPIQYEESKRIQLDSFQPGPSTAQRTGPHTDTDNIINNYTILPTNRSSNLQTNTFGSGFSAAVGAVIAPLMDILKPSRKEEYACNVRTFGNGTSEVKSTYVQGNTSIAPTIKESTMYVPHGNIGNQKSDAYMVTPVQPSSTQRDLAPTDRVNGMTSKYGYVQNGIHTTNQMKERSLTGRTNQGNTQIFSPTVNVQLSKQAQENARVLVPQRMSYTGPSAQTQGCMYDANNNIHAIDDCSRIDPGLLQAFKQNPYTHSLHSVA